MKKEIETETDDFMDDLPAKSFGAHTAEASQDIAEEIDLLIPEELICEKPCPHGKAKPLSLLMYIYLASLVLEILILSADFFVPYSPLSSALFFIFCPVICALWVYRAKMNTLLMGAKRTTIPPLCCSLFMLIPAFNTLSLYPVFQELWKSSCAPKYWEKAKSSLLITFWSILRLSSLVLVFMSIYSSEAHLLPRENDLIIYGAIPLSIGCVLLEAGIVILITAKQTKYIHLCAADMNDQALVNLNSSK